MDARIAGLISESDGLKLRESYSGRGMYGRETAAVEYDSLAELLVGVATAMRDNGDPDEEEDIIDALYKVRTDSMGRSFVIY